jgi:DNA processing protein
MDKDSQIWLRLAYVGFPAGRLANILERWKTPEALFDATRNGKDGALLETSGITKQSIERLREAAERDLTKSLEAMDQYGIRMLMLEDESYPALLKQIPDPPLYMFVRGELKSTDIKSVAIVGTRNVTDYGAGIAEKFASELASHGFTVVSGLARGIDTFAHRGALRGNGRTLAICGCGLDVVYPSENKQLMADIVDNGACLSEYPPGDQPLNWHFPARNRIISGLSQAVVVVESGAKSGALITADFALEQGKEIFAVPGNVHRMQSRGPHSIIKQGAYLAESVDDILAVLENRALPLENSEMESTFEVKPREDLSATENRLMLLLDVEPKFIDDLATSAKMSAAEVNATLVMLEIKGAAKRLPGNTFARVI